MNKILISFGFLLLASCTLLGGWSTLDTNNLSSNAKQALSIAVSNVQKTLQSSYGSANYVSVTGGQSQVVAGIKYKFQLSFSVLIEGDILTIKNYEAVMWQQPAGYNGANSAEAFVFLSVTSLDDDDNNTLNLAISGGWSNINGNNLDSWAQNALSAAIAQVESLFQTNSPSLVGVQSVQTQIVAGQNYKFVIQFDLGTFEVVVWRKLDGSYQVTQTTQLATAQRLGSTAGGWSALNVDNLDDWATEASSLAISRAASLLKGSNGAFSSIASAQSQIVAGTNYNFRLEFSTDDGTTYYEVIVWRKLDGTYKITSANQKTLLGVDGGWSQLDSNNLDQYAEEAANMAIANVKILLQSSNGQFSSIEFAQSQVVAGTNYKFHLQFFAGDGGRIHYEVVIWRQLSGTYVLTSAQVAN
jgi:hypothetical protein